MIEEISERIGVVPLERLAGCGSSGRVGVKLSPSARWSTCCSGLGPRGDRFGLRRGGLSVGKLRRNPHGVVLDEHLAAGRAA